MAKKPIQCFFCTKFKPKGTIINGTCTAYNNPVFDAFKSSADCPKFNRRGVE